MVGISLFERMFEIAPEQWSDVFQWSKKDFEEKDEKAMTFIKKFVKMLDMAIDMLGPDMEIVEDQLYELGTFHQRYGVTPKHFEMMGKSLIYTLKKILGEQKFGPKTEKSWKEIYSFMSLTMIQGAAGI